MVAASCPYVRYLPMNAHPAPQGRLRQFDRWYRTEVIKTKAKRLLELSLKVAGIERTRFPCFIDTDDDDWNR